MSNYSINTRLSTIYDSSGHSTSTLKLTLTNLTSKNYPTALKILIDGPQILPISVSDSQNNLTFSSSYDSLGTNRIEIQLSQNRVGKNTQSELTLLYENPDAQRSENTWIVFFPKITTGFPGSYEYQATIPKSFGRLIAAENIPEIEPFSQTSNLYTLKGNSLPTSSRIIFGDSYPYQYTLVFNNTDSVVLPKDTEAQKIYITGLQPPPQKIISQDNLWIAQYPKVQTEVSVSGYAVYFNQNDKMINDHLVQFNEHPYQYLPAKPVNINLSSPKLYFPFVNNQLQIDLYNSNFQAVYNYSFRLDSAGMNLPQSIPIIPEIPPLGSATINIPIKLELRHLFLPKSIQVSSQYNHFSYNPTTNSLIIYYIVFCALLSIILIVAIYSAWRAWSIFVRRS